MAKYSFFLLFVFSSLAFSQVNLVSNGSFENGSDSWNLYSGASRVDNNTQSGSWAVKLGNNNGAEQKITGLRPNTTYRVTGWAKVTGPNAMRIGVKRHGGNVKSYRFSSSTYTQGSFTFTTGFGATSAIVYAYKPKGDDAGYADNITVTYESESPYELVWSDEFNGSGSFDTNTWGHEKGFVRNKELQWYQKDNVFQENGNLVIEGRKERRPNPNYEAGSDNWKKSREFINYTSGSITSRKSASWLYGRVVVRAKVTNFTGTWPAIWMLGNSCEWPSSGEIDIMENYGGNILANYAWGTDKRWTAKWDSSKKSVNSLGSGWTDEYHIWELDWDEERMTISVDGVFLNDVLLSNTINGSSKCAGQNPFKQRQYILLNLALGANGGSVNNLSFPTRYLVDYVRVYQLGDGNDANDTIIEAESATLNGIAEVYNDAAASNGQGVSFISEVGSGLVINNVPASRSVRVRYASINSGGISVYINGIDSGTLNFNATGDWTGQYNESVFNIDVPAGATFEIRYEDGDQALNVDRITFVGNDGSETPSPQPTQTATPTIRPTATPTITTTPTITPRPTVTPTVKPTPTLTPRPSTPTPLVTQTPVTPVATLKVEAESGTTTGSARAFSDDAASGSSGIAFISEVGAGVTLSNLPASRSFDIIYTSEVSGEISLRVNGVDSGNVAFDSTGAWIENYTSVTVNQTIPANSSVEIFFESGDAAMNIDYLEMALLNGATPIPTLTPTATPEPTATPIDDTGYYIIHRPTDYKLHSCGSENGSAVTAADESLTSRCVQWMKVSIGDYFHIKNQASLKHLKPDSKLNGAPVSMQPSHWVGNWTQWQFVERDSGYGHIKNRATGKYLYVAGNGLNKPIVQQPATWKGHYTQFKFESIR